MSKTRNEPQWPVLIHYTNDPELDLVISPAEWLNREEIKQMKFQPDDKIIDSNGWIFELPTNKSEQSVLNYTGTQMKLEDLLGLIKAHMSESGACCVAKLYAPDYLEAFKIIINEKKGEA